MWNGKMSDFDYINRTYGLSLKRGARVEYSGNDSRNPKRGTVMKSDGAYIYVRFDDAPNKVVGPFHPTWEMRQVGEPSHD